MTSASGGVGRVKAWACLAANALVLPGLGSIAGGRHFGGALQALLSLGGFALTMLWAGSWIERAATTGLPEDLGPYFGHAVAGLSVFALAWLWGLLTGLSLVRAAGTPHASKPAPSAD